MPILDIQKRARELGRIRIGQVVPTNNGKTRPEKLDRFRLTSQSKTLLEKVAELYGGEVREWQPQGGGSKAWEVITETNRIPILVPPEPVTQWMEHWTGGGCKRRCDGNLEVLSDSPCICKANETILCKPTTRLNVVLRDVEGVGVWRLETHGFNAAIELPNAAHFLAQADGYIDGHLALEERTSKAEVVKNGETKIETRHFMVPIIEIAVTPAELMAGQGGIKPPALEGPVPKTPELEAPADLYAPYFERLAEAETLAGCQAIWKEMVDQHLVGTEAPSNPNANPNRITEFLAAYKAKGTSLPPAAPAEPQPDADGAYPAEVVADGDADAIWAQIVVEAGKRDMTTADLEDDFASRMGGQSSSTASASELQHYLGLLTEAPAA